MRRMSETIDQHEPVGHPTSQQFSFSVLLQEPSFATNFQSCILEELKMASALTFSPSAQEPSQQHAFKKNTIQEIYHAIVYLLEGTGRLCSVVEIALARLLNLPRVQVWSLSERSSGLGRGETPLHKEYLGEQFWESTVHRSVPQPVQLETTAQEADNLKVSVCDTALACMWQNSPLSPTVTEMKPEAPISDRSARSPVARGTLLNSEIMLMCLYEIKRTFSSRHLKFPGTLTIT